MVNNRRLISITLSILILISFITSYNTFAKEKIVFLNPPAGQLSPEISFLEKEPVIDGKLDDDMKILPKRDFSLIYMNNDSHPAAAATYRIAYGMEFLYIFIEVEADKYICRDRGYQNGDGIILVLTKTNQTKKDSDEKYMLAFNPTTNKNKPYNKMIWYYNNKWPFMPFKDDTKFAVSVNNGRVGFELALQWKDIYPYHPQLMEEMYFNLFFTKAVGETDVDYYVVAVDPSSKDYWSATSKMIFQKPEIEGGAKSYLVFDKNNIEVNEEINAKVVSLSDEPRSENVALFLFTADNAMVDRTIHEIKLEKGLTISDFKYNSGNLIPDGYNVKWRTESGGSSGELPLTVLPPLDQKKMENVINSLEGKISAGSMNTIRFTFNNILQERNFLKSYDTAGSVRVRVYNLMEIIDKALSGEDAIAKKTGYVRRAFLSKLDNTLQPYTIRIPKDYNPSKLYPAIVFLHGSDSDDTSIKAIPSIFFPDDFIIIAPNARGPLTYYVLDNAQEDIQETITDAVKNYSIDSKKLVISGFSMGGYGTYRTLYETPGKYVGAAVFSGEPAIELSEKPGEYPDFSNPKYLDRFKGMDIAIIHGKKDRNCPYEKTEDIAKKLESAGAKVLFLVDPEVGHSTPLDPAVIKAYLEWLRKVTGTK
jgi:predicted esterase